MSLWNVKNKLYKKEKDPSLGTHEPSEYDPKISGGGLGDPGAKDLWAKKQDFDFKKSTPIRRGLYAFGGIIFVLLLMLGGYAIFRGMFSGDRVTVVIAGPKEALSGKLLTYEITYKNDNQIGLNNAELRLTYPETFKPEDNLNFKIEGPVSGIYSLGKIAAHGQGKVILNGRVYSPKGALIYIKSGLAYSPGSFTIRYISEVQFGVNLTSSSLSIEVVGPQFISSGDEVNYLITYKNNGEEDVDNLKVMAEYPDGFTFSSSEPKVFESNNVWYLGRLSKGQEGKIIASGRLEGDRDMVKVINVAIGETSEGKLISLADESAQTKIASSPLAISQTVNGVPNLSANAGDGLRFEIHYKNVGNIGLRDVIVKETLASPVIDYTTLKLDGGSFNDSNKTIIWKASDYPGLRNLLPGQEGMISFAVNVKDVIPVSGANDKNFVISSVAKIDSPDVPTPVSMNKIIAGNKMDIKLNSKLVVDVKGYYTDAGIPNSGPLPPKVGSDTTYTIHWLLTNVSNDISKAKVEANLPTGAIMTGKQLPEDANLTYNERSNALSWEIGNIDSGVGILSPPKEVSFQVKITPSSEQVGRKADLIYETKFTATDNFTGENVSTTAPLKNTELREDASVASSYNVAN